MTVLDIKTERSRPYTKAKMDKKEVSKTRVSAPMTKEDEAEILSLHMQGWSVREIARKLNRGKTPIHRRIVKFANHLDNPDMSRKKLKASTRRAKARRLTGIKAPERGLQAACISSNESLEEKVRRLERELADTRLARDFYNEMISVAESQFNINIRKKAGTRQ